MSIALRASMLVGSLLLVAGCNGAPEQLSEQSEQEVAPAVVVPTEAVEETAEAVEAPTPSPADEEPSLVPMMQAIGYTGADDVDLAEFVHAPPAARAEAGSFGNGANQVRVALIIYPNPRYAEPHYHDVRERVAVVPGEGEAVLLHESIVIHIRAVDRDTAVDTRNRLATSLGWDVQ